MSSTKRGSVREVSDYYYTPVPHVVDFLKALVEVEPTALNGKVLDPCAGGDAQVPMSYPAALVQMGVPEERIFTLDIREDSPAQFKGDYLQAAAQTDFNLVITNPPFALAQEIISKALRETPQGGYVAMLLRLNFFGSQKRQAFWSTNMAKHCFVHSHRIKFRNTKTTDSIEYMHCVWQVGYHPEHTMLRII